MIRGQVEVEGSNENGKTDIEEKSSILDMLVFAIDFDSDAILLECPRCTEHTDGLHWHY